MVRVRVDRPTAGWSFFPLEGLPFRALPGVEVEQGAFPEQGLVELYFPHVVTQVGELIVLLG